MGLIKLRRSWLAATAIAPLAFGASATAQTTATTAAPRAAATDVGELIVTARKREETLHDAPLTVSVVSGESLRESPLASASALNGAVPGLAIQIGTGNVSSPTFRGLGSNSALYSVESSVALFIDGVYMGHPRAYATPLYDIERFEMIKGTQATLLGKNTSLGAISQITRRPTNNFGYELTGTSEFEYGSQRLEGALNVPVADNLAVRIAAVYDLDGGYMENAFTGDGEGKTENVSGRLSLRWTPTEALEIDASYQHDHRIQWGQYMEILRDATAGGIIANRALQIGQTNFEARPNLRTQAASFGFGTVPAGPAINDKQTGDRVNVVASLDLGAVELTSQSAYVSYDVLRASDLDFTSARLLDLVDNERDRQFTQEVRLTSKAEGPLSYMVGAYYLRESWSLDRTLAGFSPSPGVFPLTGAVTTFFTQKTRAASLFSHVDYEINEQLTASGGLRYTSERKRGHYLRLPGSGVLGISSPAIPASVVEVEDDTLDGDVGLQYRPNGELMLYATFSKGSKSGGLQHAPTTLAAAAYTGETAYTTEVGAKKLFGGVGSLDVALFNTDVKDYQFTRIAAVGGVNQTIVANVDIRSRGVEVNSMWRFDGLPRLSFGFVYADVKSRETVPSPPAQAALVKGLRLPRAPELTGNIALEHVTPVNEEFDLKLKAEGQYSSPMFLQPNINASLGAPKRAEYLQVHARAALVNHVRGYEIALVGRNLTDVRTPIFASPTSGTGISGTNTTAYTGTLLPPRTIALQVSLRR